MSRARERSRARIWELRTRFTQTDQHDTPRQR
eukprot:COSAG05_NODE_13231_length_437_cov_1.357988_1_plen_31_part_10